MTFAVTFTVDGSPVAKGRPRFAKRGKFVQTYTPQKTKDYEALVMDAASDAMGSSEPLETPVAFYLYIHMPIPKSYSKRLRQDCLDGIEKPIKKPDWDNIAKAVTDALNGIVYVDDCQIVTAHVKKAYSDTPRIEVLIQEEIE
jgi:Holliday junction resolvase RusA-like endonuclease